MPLSADQRLEMALIEGTLEELEPDQSPPDMGNAFAVGHSVRPTILVVEDNADMNRFIVECLSQDYTVVSAFNGEEGFETALQVHPALIVTDVMMPKVSGVEMIGQMRQHPALMNTPIILLTAKADEELKVKLLTNGAQDFVAKPFSERELSIRVKNLIALNQAEVCHQTLFNSMDEGFCTIEVLFDENQHPIDYRFVEINGAFERQTGLKDARGKRMRELAPRHEQYWFDTYGKIALTGEPARFENRAEALGRWYEVYAFRIGRPDSRQVAIFFNDITDRKRTAFALETAGQSLTRANSELTQTNEELKKANAKLQEQITELEALHDVVVGRELKMMKLERENQQLRMRHPDQKTSDQ